jgi:hypothetical protein
MAKEVCELHTDPADHEPAAVLTHELVYNGFCDWCEHHGVDAMTELVLAAAVATQRCGATQAERCDLLDVAHPMTKHLRRSLPSSAIREVRDCVLDVATCEPPTPEMTLDIEDEDHSDDLAIALITWLAALGCAYAAVTDGTVDDALHHLLPDHPRL